MLESEIKIPRTSKANIVELFNDIIRLSMSFVRDVYYDTQTKTMSSEDTVLRLRSIDGAGKLTYKGPRQKRDDRIIGRDEFEVSVDDPLEAETILLSLKYIPRDITEKYRERCYHPKFPKLIITIDKYPFIGEMLEIEGAEDDINSIIKMYGIDCIQCDTRNCTEAFCDYCDTNHLSHKISYRTDFTFNAESNHINKE